MFVESYGRVAVQIAPRIDAVLDQGTAQLRAAGFSSRSAFLTSPTFGGLSWLAHSTLQSGVLVDGQRRYDQLVKADRVTLTRAFKRAGWRAVGVMPANRRAWPEGHSFYRYDAIYDRRNLGYRGPDFGLPPMPDQYTFLALQRRELARRQRPPLFAEVDLISSHAPWTRIPRLISWDDVGDGSIFDRIPADGGRLRDAGESAPPTGIRSSTRSARSSRSCSATATRTSCSSSSATISPRRSSPARARATTCRSRSSPTIRR